VLSILGVLVLASALLARERVSGRAGDPRLTAYSADPLGARLLYELADRLGWTVNRARTPLAALDRGTVVAVLDPTETIRPADAHAMLEHVRGGGAMLLALGARTQALSDSLGIRAGTAGGYVDSRAGTAEPCRGGRRFTRSGLWVGVATLLPVAGRGLRAAGSDTLVHVRIDTRRSGPSLQPALVAMPLGRGRIVVTADPDVFRNDALRDCRYGLDVPVVRALEYLAAGGTAPRTVLRFDEYHQARFASAGMTGAIKRYLTATKSGNALLQLCAAGILLIIALAPRLLVPRDDTRVERRSPLEHVDALARAYEQTRASRTATLRLVRGLRRRVDRGARVRTSESDAAFLSRVAETTPSLAGDTAIVRNALDTTVPPKQFSETGDAIARIEAALTKS